MSDLLKTNWFDQIRTNPIANAWDWEDKDGEKHYLGEYIFQDKYIPANVPKVKQTKQKKQQKRKRKTKLRNRKK